MKLYAVSDGPPSLACRMVLKALNIPFDLIPVNFNVGEHLTDEYFKVIKRMQRFLDDAHNTMEVFISGIFFPFCIL